MDPNLFLYTLSMLFAILDIPSKKLEVSAHSMITRNVVAFKKKKPSPIGEKPSSELIPQSRVVTVL